MPLHSTTRTSLVDLVIEQMERLIAEGEWPVGTKIPAEPLLVEQLGVGRNTVREAVRALVHTGMLEPRQGDGTYVRAGSGFGAAVQRRLRRAAQLEAYEVRASLERDAARYAAQRRTEEDLRALRAALEDRGHAWRSGEVNAFIDADMAFHRTVAAAAHNSVLAELYEHLGDALRTTLQAVVGSPVPDSVRHQCDAHRALVDAIEARDADGAERIALAHLAEGMAALRASCPPSGGDAPADDLTADAAPAGAAATADARPGPGSSGALHA
ncbi:FadR/GntR family transcriptional regulator [Streptomyces sp. MST-110588]|uniref:FadR/GntR family transcriptional regulator n=1 Tax=Streptomyces sp. MST-110588 TaxID=2833628 RepID=UPI001F5C5BF5|nr:FadR/GntR family transcriptional regulator [Streptomyces sp. MST-110588]UNO39985.1 FadR family transcriptional regulator [Streptomyces sp. MST-110588]